MSAGGRADGQGMGECGDAGAEHYPGGQEGRGEPVTRADAVAAVSSGHGAARVDGMH
jgi:hypothetical protein